MPLPALLGPVPDLVAAKVEVVLGEGLHGFYDKISEEVVGTVFRWVENVRRHFVAFTVEAFGEEPGLALPGADVA